VNGGGDELDRLDARRDVGDAGDLELKQAAFLLVPVFMRRHAPRKRGIQYPQARAVVTGLPACAGNDGVPGEWMMHPIAAGALYRQYSKLT
jgi:hypothetical protein